MRSRLTIRPEAEADMAEAFDWYEARHTGLGHQFLAQVQAALDSIAEHPLHYPLLYRNARRILTRRFPYKIFFIAENDRVEVIGVAHVRRHPQAWQKRL